MATELPPQTIATPTAETTFRPVVKRSWKARLLIIGDGVIAFVLAFLDYTGAIRLTDFGITPERAVFYMACLNLLKFFLLQFRSIQSVDLRPEPTRGQG